MPFSLCIIGIIPQKVGTFCGKSSVIIISKYDEEIIIMTKSDIERIVKRYKYVTKLVKERREELSFYIGNRKQKIVLTEETKKICEVIEDICARMETGWIKDLIQDLLNGKSDVALLHVYPCGRSLYYTIKHEFIETIYRCCIANQMVTYDELVKIGIEK